MSTLIFNLKATPNSISTTNNEQEVVISWDSFMGSATDNPVNIELNILPDSPVFFVSSSNQNVKAVTWRQNFNPGYNSYQETVIVKVTQQQGQAKVTKLRMDTRDSGGVMSSGITFLIYK